MTYFTIEELCASATARRKAIENVPNTAQMQALKELVDNILDPLRKAFGKPIIVNSGFRCTKLNRAVGGVANSQHCKGEAADIRTTTNLPSDNKKLFDLAKKLKLPFDQLIDEYGYSWIHVSYSKNRQRRQVLHLK